MISKKRYGSNKIPRIKIIMGDDVRARRVVREKREKGQENIVWEKGDECVWQEEEEWKMLSLIHI